MRNLHHFLVTAAVIFLVSNHPYVAWGRILNKDGLVLQSVQKGIPTPPSEHSGCTHIPGRTGPPCIGQRAFASHVMSPPVLQPDRMVPFHASA
ncbi:hypothetical protein F3Y22_tig00111099pilonHSYRG00266 [Hibiscus syriacus]|uniref:Uncharacterized protein n=1 Tax=Hibiscus syriacus TaxID=106335 RepID=A0A6A2Z2T2_HIBSY|nr:hypothetical protein F3Y22_tig00111099pilonHSYRG00266 [Hibiscus syriacus]